MKGNGKPLSRVAIIIPCYNEEYRLDKEAFISFSVKDASQNFDLFFVNDGSTDNTMDILNELSASNSNIHAIDLPKNSGKAEAIRVGINSIIMQNDYDFVGFFDADLATPIEELYKFQAYLKFNPIMIIGTRISILGQTVIKRKAARHYVGRIFATIVSNMLKLSIYDTQCGAKIIRADIAKYIFKQPFTSKWLFDVELFFRVKPLLRYEKKELLEHPVSSWEDKAGSKIKPSYFLIAPFDLLRIYLKYK